MTIDGIMLHAVVCELQGLSGGRVERVFQPEKDEIALAIHHPSKGNCRLLLSANATNCHVSLTGQSKPNPDHPPMFCMLLRKHLQGARITQISQEGLERVVCLRFEGRNDLGDSDIYYLVAEIMGRHSNIILLDNEKIILDSIKRVGETVSSVRHILPGRPYQAPPAQDKQNPLELDKAAFERIASAYIGNMLRTFIASALQGISPAAAREIAYRAFGNEDYAQPIDENGRKRLFAELWSFFSAVKQADFAPQLLYAPDGELLGFTPFLYRQYGLSLQKSAASANQAVDLYYSGREQAEKLRQKSQSLQKSVEARVEKLQKKRAIHLESIGQTEKMENLRLFGELLTAGLHGVANGATARVLNYYTGEPVDIPMDPRLSPSANAQRYYKLYRKAKVAQKLALESIGALEKEISYLEGQLYSISACTTVDELEEIRFELEQAGYLRRNLMRKSKKIPPSRPFHYRSSDGLDIFVGKNNTQNDILTLKTAAPDDIWLHTKEIPGSHVIVKANGGSVSDTAIYEAALLAAHHSKARGSSNIAVDYCSRRYVKKPGGAKAGMVIYTTNKTAYVTPSPEAVSAIQRVE